MEWRSIKSSIADFCKLSSAISRFLFFEEMLDTKV